MATTGGESTAAARPGEALDAYAAFVAERAHGLVLDEALPRGRTVSLPMMDATDDVPLDLDAHVGRRRAVLIFYPGGWCAGSRAALAAFEMARPAFERRETVLVAVTPELPRRAGETARAIGIGFSIAIDHRCRFAKSLGLAFKLPVALRRAVRDDGLRLKPWNGEGSYDLPMPVALLLDRRRRVRWHAAGLTPAGLEPAAALAAAAAMPPAD